MKKLRAADLYCGAGGTSAALVRAARKLGYSVELTAINHWDVAVATHEQNIAARHLCAHLDNVNPRDLYKPGQLDLLWGSPECIFHSRARGGKPVNDQKRATAFCLCRWAEALMPPIILVENVREFLDWAPLGTNGKPLKSRRGEVYRAWRNVFEALGYRIEEKMLCAANYGDPTTRERLFIQMVRGRRPLRWPDATHQETQEGADLFGVERLPWKSARDHVIDWKLRGGLLSERKRPLKPKTIKRILAGFLRFGLRPFIVPQQSGGICRHVSQPLPSITTTARGIGLAEPFVVHLRGCSGARSVDDPVPSITAGGGHFGLVDPILVQVAHGNGNEKHGDARRSRSIDTPFPTVCGSRGEWALCEPFVTSIDHYGSNGGCSASIDTPLSAVTTKQRHALIEPFIVKFYGSNVGQSIDEPLHTVTTKDRFGLAFPIPIEINGERLGLDFRFRMFQPHELARAQGFPDDYKFAGNKTEVVRQIGNANPGELTEAIISAVLEDRK